MPEQDTEDDLDEQGEDEQQRTVTLARRQIRALERKAKGFDDAVTEAATLKRELAFARAGLPDDAKTGYFTKAYDGDLTPEAIRAAAEAAGFLEAPKAEPPKEERATHERMADASAGATTAPPVDFQAEIAQAKSPAEVMAIVKRAGLPTTWDQ